MRAAASTYPGSGETDSRRPIPKTSMTFATPTATTTTEPGTTQPAPGSARRGNPSSTSIHPVLWSLPSPLMLRRSAHRHPTLECAADSLDLQPGTTIAVHPDQPVGSHRRHPFATQRRRLSNWQVRAGDSGVKSMAATGRLTPHPSTTNFPDLSPIYET